MKNMSCFKFISCGGRGDDDEFVQNKSSQKNKWNSRRRSKKHPIFNNTLSSEPASEENQELKTTIGCLQEKPVDNAETAQVHSVLSKETSPAIDESSVVVIQAYISGYLARTEYRRIKSAIKLQSAMRGHMERRKALGALRSFQAIVKIQSLVRARYSLQSVEKLSAIQEDSRDDEQKSILSGEDSGEKNNRTLSPAEKLLSNAFARQLLKSASRTKSINIRIDPTNSGSAWKWMERWMSVYVPDATKKHEKIEAERPQDISEENPVIVESDRQMKNLAEPDSKLDLSKLSVVDDNATNLQSENTSAFEFQASTAVPGVEGDNFSVDNDMKMANTKDSHHKGVDDKVVNTQRSYDEVLSDPYPDNVCLDASNKPKCNSPEHSTRKESCEKLETGDKMPSTSSRKSTNLTFSAEPKFEELCSAGIDRSIDFSKSQEEDPEQENNLKATNLEGKSLSFDPDVQVAALELVTENYVSLTVDSSGRSETKDVESASEVEVSEKDNNAVNDGTDRTYEPANLDFTEENPLFYSDSVGPQSHEKDGSLADLTTVVDLVQSHQHLSEPTTSDMQATVESVVDPQHRSSPGRTPRSQATASDLHGTPSSQVSVTSKKNKKDEKDPKLPSQKLKTQSIGRKSPTNKSSDSGGKGSLENLSKDVKNMKRQNSSGMSKPDHGDQKSRISSSGSVPSYMKATESARAKAHANVSPKSSPDVHESQKKTRHSFTSESGKKGSSPQMQRSSSQVQQNSKDGSHSSPNLAGINASASFIDKACFVNLYC